MPKHFTMLGEVHDLFMFNWFCFPAPNLLFQFV